MKTVVEKSDYIGSEFEKYIKSTFNLSDKKYLAEFEEQIKNTDLIRGPFINASLPFDTAASINELVNSGKMSQGFRKLSEVDLDRKMYQHQVIAFEKISDSRNVVISTGTGSGKTECFLYPILDSIMREIESGTISSGIRAMFLYPMNALVNDQVSRIRSLLSQYPEITYGSFTGDTPETLKKNGREEKSSDEGCVIPENELLCREEIRNNPPHLLFTNYSMLEHLLIRPNDSKLLTEEFMGNWKFIVLDEAHTYKGALGIEIALLLRRLTGIANRNPQFILTSATLGDEENDVSEIVDYAESLTTTKYEKNDIVFAKRVQLDKSNIEYSIDPLIYTELVDNINDIDKIKSLLSKYRNFDNYMELNSILYDLLVRDENVYRLYRCLEKIEIFETVKSNMGGFESQNISDLIYLISKANNNNNRLFDVKYHTFIKTLDGAFITLGSNKKMKLTKHTKIDGNMAFEIGLCKFCDQIYIIGKIGNDNILYQNSEIDIDENYGDEYKARVDYFLIKEHANIDDDTLEIKEYIVCSKCGNIYESKNINAQKCECGESYGVELLKADNSDSKVKNNITKCICCGNNTTSDTGIVMAFYMSKNKATSVISHILYKTIGNNNEEKVVVEKPKSLFGKSESVEQNVDQSQKKQLITFSDSRQQASYFAVNFESNHKKLLRKRMIWDELLKNNHDEIRMSNLLYNLKKVIQENNLSDYDSEEEAYICVLHEILCTDGNNGAENIGLFAFKLNIEEIFEENGYGKNNDGILEFCEKYKISYDELIDIMNVIFHAFRTAPAVTYLYNLSQEIKKNELSFKMYDKFITIKKHTKSDSKEEVSWIPLENRVNRNLDYVMRVLQIDRNNAVEFLENIFKEAKYIKLFEISGNDDKCQMDIRKYNLHSYKDLRWYKCDVCGKVTIYNVKNKCVSKGCENGILHEINPDLEFQNNYYRNEYQNKKIERITIKEHTAQLSKDKAKDYQRKFKSGEVNILSCSTTFEMGVDVGSLETVFLRNVPPLPSNYAQRAGRAGRREESESFVVTYCGSSSHDYTYFKSPKKMIEGNINPPKFNITNKKIIVRHLLASSLGYFFRKNEQYYDNVGKLVLEGGIDEFKKYIDSNPEDLNDYINNKILDNNTRNELGDYKWFDNEILNNYSNVIQDKINDFNNEIELLKSNTDEFDKMKYYSEQIKKIRDEKVIESLSNSNIIPKYGFPVDLINLETLDSKRRVKKSNDKFTNNLSRDLSIAISEYAPGSEIIVDKKKYISRYVIEPKGTQLPKNYYFNCKHCDRYNINVIDQKSYKCQYCSEETEIHDNEYFIKPIHGFVGEEDTKTSNNMAPKRSYASETFYLGNGKSNDDKFHLNEYLSIESSDDDELFIKNDNYFYKCSTCGYTEISKPDGNKYSSIKKEHKNKSGVNCENMNLQKISIGHIFKTDVVKINISNLNSSKKALSTIFAILEGISSVLDIERTDINGVINPTSSKDYELIVFDNVPGGAGHVKRLLSESKLIEVLKQSYDRLNLNCCDDDTSCYNCLRNYNNQKLHNVLVKSEAKTVLKQVLGEYNLNNF